MGKLGKVFYLFIQETLAEYLSLKKQGAGDAMGTKTVSLCKELTA